MRSTTTVAPMLALVALLASTSACIRAFDTKRDTSGDGLGDAARDSSREGDLRPLDSAHDETSDGVLDSAPGPDLAKVDVSRDAPVKPDVTSTADSKPADASDGSVVTAPCASGSVVHSYGATMAMCQSPTLHDQCAARVACNIAGGWNLCTASQYAKRGGQTTSQSKMAWIAGCVRDGVSTATSAPVDGICSSCAAANTSSVTVAWRCSGTSSDTSNRAFVGLVTFVECRRAGANIAAAEARWRTAVTLESHDKAMCCR